jgi:polyhydroxyalkanoate synthase
MSKLDPLGLGRAWMRAMQGAGKNPGAVMEAATRYAGGIVAAVAATGARTLGADTPGPVETAPKDRRFADPAWSENPAFFMLLQGYLLWAQFVHDLVSSAGLDGVDDEKAGFAAELVVDALAPTNFLATNPAAQKRFLETGGLSLVRGLRNFLDDLATNGGLPRQVDPSAFTVGENLAITPGKVVYRNDLMELIQYAPATKTVFETPLLLSPPWINKYYIMDLAPGRSFVEWAVKHGHTVFTISYRNPGPADGGLTLDDYALRGPVAALDVIREITGAEQANIVGLCLGGTLTSMLLTYLAEHGDERVRSATLLNTLVDFSSPGRLGALTDESSLDFLVSRMEERGGYLEAFEMMNTFTFMRANDLVWNYVVNNWLLGEPPPAFDILAWNSDGTRMPGTMHEFLVRSCYLRNDFARGEIKLAGAGVHPADLTGDLYVLAAQEDHITPWRGSYLTTQVLGNANIRFVLSAAGHIAGIVNPPNPKAWYRTGEDKFPADSEQWLAGTTRHEGSWWEDWATWIGKRAGKRVPVPAMGGDRHPPIADAPGTYVLEK